jgi:hypothetical protein
MKRVVICGAGVSVKEGISLGLWEKIRNEEIWSINFVFLTMNFLPKREIWIDVAFFKNNIDKLQELYKRGVICCAKKHPKYATIPEIKTYETTRNIHEAKDKVFIGSMGLSGFFALHLACLENYDEINLLGFDFGVVGNPLDRQTHYYQNELTNIQSSGVGHPELYLSDDRKSIKPQVKEFEFFLSYPSKIYNVSPQSNIQCFEKISYEQMFERIKNEND